MPLPVFDLPDECSGRHDYQPHDHAHVPESLGAEWSPSDRCSERYWCRACKRWYDGPNCFAVPAAFRRVKVPETA